MLDLRTKRIGEYEQPDAWWVERTKVRASDGSRAVRMWSSARNRRSDHPRRVPPTSRVPEACVTRRMTRSDGEWRTCRQPSRWCSDAEAGRADDRLPQAPPTSTLTSSGRCTCGDSRNQESAGETGGETQHGEAHDRQEGRHAQVDR